MNPFASSTGSTRKSATKRPFGPTDSQRTSRKWKGRAGAFCRGLGSNPRSEPVDAAQDVGERIAGDRDFGRLERDVTAVAHHLRTDLDPLLAQSGRRPVLDRLWRCERPARLRSRSADDPASMSAVGRKADMFRQKVNVEGVGSAGIQTETHPPDRVSSRCFFKYGMNGVPPVPTLFGLARLSPAWRKIYRAAYSRWMERNSSTRRRQAS